MSSFVEINSHTIYSMVANVMNIFQILFLLLFFSLEIKAEDKKNTTFAELVLNHALKDKVKNELEFFEKNGYTDVSIIERSDIMGVSIIRYKLSDKKEALVQVISGVKEEGGKFREIDAISIYPSLSGKLNWKVGAKHTWAKIRIKEGRILK